MSAEKTSFLFVGAGAIGAFMGGCLAQDPTNHVVLIARGAHYQAMKSNGLVLHLNSQNKEKQETKIVHSCIVHEKLDQVSLVGGFDVIFLCVKAHQLIDIAQDASWARLMHKNTHLVTLQNGLPWYLFLARDKSDPFFGRRFPKSDPNQVLERAFPVDQIIGCVAMPACSLKAPGVVEHYEGWALPMSKPPELNKAGAALNSVGFSCQYFPDFEQELWVKILGSAMFNPVSALTGSRLGDFSHSEESKNFTIRGMEEVRKVALSVGVTIPVQSARRLAGASKLKDHKTSMLQDSEAHKRLEFEALLGTVVEVAKWTQTEIPVLSVVYELISLKDYVLHHRSSL